MVATRPLAEAAGRSTAYLRDHSLRQWQTTRGTPLRPQRRLPRKSTPARPSRPRRYPRASSSDPTGSRTSPPATHPGLYDPTANISLFQLSKLHLLRLLGLPDKVVPQNREACPRLPPRLRGTRPQLLDAPPLDRGAVPRGTLRDAAVRPRRLRGTLRKAVPLLAVRRGLPIIHRAAEARGGQPGRVRDVALRRAQRGQSEAGKARVRLQAVGAEVEDGVERWELRLREGGNVRM